MRSLAVGSEANLNPTPHIAISSAAPLRLHLSVFLPSLPFLFLLKRNTCGSRAEVVRVVVVVVV